MPDHIDRANPETTADAEAAADATAGDWSGEALRAALGRAADWTVDYRKRIEERPVLPDVAPGDVRRALAKAPPCSPEPFERILADFDEHIASGLTHWNHPGFLAYFSSSTRAPSIVAELLVAAVGVNAMLWRTSPAATEVERTAVDWLRQAVGLPDTFTGLIFDTASTATFTALLAARERAGDGVRDDGLPGGPALAVYTSEQSHSSVEKSAIAAGLGRGSVRRIETDDAFRMRPDALKAAIGEDIEGGIRPAMVCATIGTTSTASVDPVAEVAAIARRHGVWLHVDAAYAGPAAMVAEQRALFRGWEAADSIVLNPHKWLGTSLDCSVLLYRDADPFRASLALTPTYLESEDDETNLMDIGLALGRRFRGLKLWVLFRCVGTDGLAETMRRHIAMAEAAAARLAEGGVFELAAPVSFSTVCFRAAREGDPAGEERWNRDILARVNAGGRSFLSHTELDGRYTVRLSVGSVHTEERHLDDALEALHRAAADLSPGEPG
ncbi:MAG: aminotransferase class I/II-fold pyridoxal phosphate-dependent enzyme [Gemmatimonadota bacterium]|uniref:pyridoxal phosphate-dependent decarboxylase family protein n=1 Tax=Candidatus Palauibacter scopulicola TaxID=3056741 RepID=UPI002398758D|nr:aminotransferase class I/II-fold pyridoxal phosphate-dependent enzyme [Candidatus Palauibacter scopulicola]MDE2661628.1 aminotransferase class I/II-fold pyridoxal phosphate-dependent enzyme [Candidatus Palauibacter scopulicola]